VVPSKKQTATSICNAFVKAIKANVTLEDNPTARWKKADDSSSADHNVLEELNAAIDEIVEYLESPAGKIFLETKTDINSPGKIKSLFDEAVAGINALIEGIQGAKKAKEQIYTQLIATVAAQYPDARLKKNDVEEAASKSNAALVAELNTNHIPKECGGAGNCGPLSILGALNMAGMAVSDPALQAVINNFKKEDHVAATELRKALLAYIKKPGNVAAQEKAGLYMVPAGAPIDMNIMTGDATNGYFYKPTEYDEDLLKLTHWFSDAEMNLVAKMLNINIVLAVKGEDPKTGAGRTTIQRKETQDENPAGTIYLYNYEGAHYQAYPARTQATIEPRTTKPLSDTTEPNREPSPLSSPILTSLQQQTQEVALLVNDLKNNGMDDEKGKKLDTAILSMFDKIKEKVVAVTELKKDVQPIIDSLEEVKIGAGEEEEFRDVLRGHRHAQILFDNISFATLALDSPIRVALQAYIRLPCDVRVAVLSRFVNQSIEKINNHSEFAPLLSILYENAELAASQFPVDKNRFIMQAASNLKSVYSLDKVSDEELGIPYVAGQHPDINRINAAQANLDNAIRNSEITKDDPLFNIIQTAITCARQVVEKYNELHPDVAIKTKAVAPKPEKKFSPAPKKLSNAELLEKFQQSKNHVVELLTVLLDEKNQTHENITKTRNEVEGLASQDKQYTPVSQLINLMFISRWDRRIKSFIEMASKKIDDLTLPKDDPIMIALRSALQAALDAVHDDEKRHPLHIIPPAPSLGSSSSLSPLVTDEYKNPGFLYLQPILDKTITPANNEKQASKKIYECALMLQELLDENPKMKSDRIEELRGLCLRFSMGDVSVRYFKEIFDELSEEDFRDPDEPWELLESLQSRKATIFNYVDIIAKNRFAPSLQVLEQAFVLPKEMNNKSDLEKSEELLYNFVAALSSIQKSIELENPAFAIWFQEICKRLEQFMSKDKHASSIEEIKQLIESAIDPDPLLLDLKTILDYNIIHITEALTYIQDSRDNALTLQSNDPKTTNVVFGIFLNKHYGEFGPSKEFRTIKDSSGPITLHNKTKGDNYEPKPLVTFTPSIKPAAPGVVPFADCNFSDIYEGAKAAFIVMNKFKAENPSAECSVDNPKLISDADYKNFLQALYDATKSADGKYMMNEVKINFTETSIRQNFIEILSGRVDIGLSSNVVAALKDNFGQPKTFEYTGAMMARPPRATKKVPLKTQGLFIDADYQPKPAATVTAPIIPSVSTRPGSSTSSL